MNRTSLVDLAVLGRRGESWSKGGEMWIGDETEPRVTVVLHPEPALGDLFGSLKLNRPVASTYEEKQAARDAMAQETAGKDNP